MVYALNMSSNTLTALIICIAIGVLAIIGLIITAVVIARYKKANKYDAVSVPNTAPVQTKSLAAPDRPQLPAPEEVKAEDESTATDDPVTEEVSEAEESAEEVQESAEPEKAEEPEEVETVEEPAEEVSEVTEPEKAEEPEEAEGVEEPVAEEVEEPAEPETAEVVEEVAEQSEEVEEVAEEQPEEEAAEQPAEEPGVEAVEEEQLVAEQSVEEEAVESEAPVAEETVETEQPAEPETAEVTEAVVEQPAEKQVDEGSFEAKTAQREIIPAATRVVPEGKILVKVRYNRSYTARLIQSQDTLKSYYDEVKNELMRYGVSNRISWKHETFRKGRKLLARFGVRGKTLGVYLALNPADFENTKYKVDDVSGVKRNAAVPSLYRIKNDRRCRYVKDLIAKLMAENGLEAGEERNEKYSAQYPYEELEPLIDRKLVKLLRWKEVVAGSEVGLIAVSKDDLPTEILMGEVSVAEAEEMFVGTNIDALVESSTKRADKTKKDIVNIDTLGKYFESGETVTINEIKKRVPGINKKTTYIKVLARGKLDKSLTIEADDFSPAAIKMIVLTGGKVIRTEAAK